MNEQNNPIGRPKLRLRLSDKVVHGMNRQQYKQASHWIRSASRLIDAKIDWDAGYRHISDAMIFGYSEIRTEDLVKN